MISMRLSKTDHLNEIILKVDSSQVGQTVKDADGQRCQIVAAQIDGAQAVETAEDAAGHTVDVVVTDVQ